MEIKPVEHTTRTVKGKRVTVGGVTVTVELNNGELDIRVGRCDTSADESGQVALSRSGKGHVNVYVDGEEPGQTLNDRFPLYRRTVSN
jgi:hypothetical protein